LRGKKTSRVLDPAKEIADLSDAIRDFGTPFGESIVKSSFEMTALLSGWLGHLYLSEGHASAKELLQGVQASINEAAALFGIGLMRPAVFSVRSQADMMLSWLYFKDHPIEWNLLQTDGESFKLKREVIRYLEDFFPAFKSKFALLREAKRRSLADPYRALSVHVHSQTAFAIPQLGPLAGLVNDHEAVKDATTLQWELSEFLSDICAALYYSDYLLLPSIVRTNISGRLSAEALKQFVL
jgi:hypothetical protein